MGNKQTRVPQIVALVAGVLGMAGTVTILLQDVYVSGQWKPVHILIPLIMLIHVATAYLAVDAAAQGKRSWALGFGVVAFAGLLCVGYASVGKQFEAAAEKASAAEAVNAPRAMLEKQIAEYEYNLAPCPPGAPPGYERDGRCGLRQSMVKECATGKGAGCTGRTHSVTLYEAGLNNFRTKLAELPPSVPVGKKSNSWAELLGFGGYDKLESERMLTLLEPVGYTLTFDIAALIALGFALHGFGRGREEAEVVLVATPPAHVRADAVQPPVFPGPATPAPAAAQPPAPVVSQPPDTKPAQPPVARKVKTPPAKKVKPPVVTPVAMPGVTAIEQHIIDKLKQGETIESQGRLAQELGANKGSVSHAVRKLELQGRVVRVQRDGRYVITLPPPPTLVVRRV